MFKACSDMMMARYWGHHLEAKRTNCDSDRLTVSRILRVNHAGELGAISIYAAQMALTGRNENLRSFLEATLIHEREHARQFAGLMPTRNTRPCGAAPLWGVGGFILGVMTAVLGRNAILICTEAVERTVHRHLDDQLEWLGARDLEVSAVILQIQSQELGHLQYAQGEQDSKTPFGRVLDGFVTASTEALIWLSTYGASGKMIRDIRH